MQLCGALTITFKLQGTALHALKWKPVLSVTHFQPLRTNYTTQEVCCFFFLLLCDIEAWKKGMGLAPSSTHIIPSAVPLRGMPIACASPEQVIDTFVV